MTSEPERFRKRMLSHQIELAPTGKGSDWLNPNDTWELAEHGLSRGFGVSKMEAYAFGASRGKLRIYYQILGVDDPGENWVDHRDPRVALDLVKQKLSEASKDAVKLRYKIWLDLP